MNSNLQPISDLTLTHRKVSPRLFADAIGLMAVTIFALAIRLHGSTVPAVWYDEAFSLLLAQQTPWQIWSISARDVHPPLYYFLLHCCIAALLDAVVW